MSMVNLRITQKPLNSDYLQSIHVQEVENLGDDYLSSPHYSMSSASWLLIAYVLKST